MTDKIKYLGICSWSPDFSSFFYIPFGLQWGGKTGGGVGIGEINDFVN